jgi:hypothetical protein
MTGISSIQNSSAERLQMLLMQQALSTAGTTTTQMTESATSAVSSADESTSNPNGMAALQEQLEEAIAEALASLDKTSGAEEVMDAVKSAIDETLQANGIDTEAMQGAPPPPPDGAPPNGAPPAGGPPPAGPPPAESSENSLTSMIDRLLEEYGFDPEEIKRELQEAMTAAANAGTSNTSLALAMQLPLNSGIDTQA